METRQTRVKSRRFRWYALTIVFYGFAGCMRPSHESTAALTQVNLLDQNGFSEVITSKEKLKPLGTMDFVGALQPYQKVSRLFKGPNGVIQGILTSYYPNGHIRQYLEIEGARAFGAYREWHENGRKKIEAQVVGGKADLDSHSECSWLFDGISSAWDHHGQLQAQISYKKGVLAGLSSYYFPSGNLSSLERFEDGARHGKCLTFFETGALFKEVSYERGERDGQAQAFLPSGHRVAVEMWTRGRLEEGIYFSHSGEKIGSVKDGSGKAVYLEPNGDYESWEFQAGRPFLIKYYGVDNLLKRSCTLSQGVRHGTEQLFYPDGSLAVEMHWAYGKIEGEQKSWYANSQLESLRLMENNKRAGLSTAWYENGQIMLVEEYETDRLVEGKYFRSGENIPVSQVKAGTGTATLFDGKGVLLKRVRYEGGEPKVLDEQ